MSQTQRIELDKVRHLRFDVNALSAFDEINKTPFFELMEGKGINMSSIRNLTWAGLIHEDPALTPSDVGNLIQTYWFERDKTIEDLLHIITGKAATDAGAKRTTTKKKSASRKKK